MDIHIYMVSPQLSTFLGVEEKVKALGAGCLHA